MKSASVGKGTWSLHSIFAYVFPLANTFGRHGLISAIDLPEATTLRGRSSLPDKKTMPIVLEKMVNMDGLCLWSHPRLRVRSTTIKCIVLNIPEPACL